MKSMPCGFKIKGTQKIINMSKRNKLEHAESIMDEYSNAHFVYCKYCNKILPNKIFSRCETRKKMEKGQTGMGDFNTL